MEPILPDPSAPNRAPSQQETLSSASPVSPVSAEVAPNVAPEQPREGAPTQASVTQPAASQPVTPPQPLPVQPLAPHQDNAATDDPVIADDVDVIEKEWVDKAKKIVNATKEDPHSQEKEVSKLQADYLMKRYNKQVKLSE